MTGSISRRALPLALLPLAVIFVALMCASALIEPPALRAAADPAAFNAIAARERLARILGDETPHPVDSDALDAVRERLLAEITALGFTPDVRDDFSCRSEPRYMACARVRNILFSIGPQSAAAILAASHYDSVPAAPGASDDGIGVAVWLEIARMLKDAPLERRVIFLISDGEEVGLLGAQAFSQDPLMDTVEAVINLEARGSRGPAIFFESNPPNADAVSAFSNVVHPVANSAMADAYQLMPNSTDVSALVRPGLDVVNLALLDGLEDYHTPQDDLASQDPRSVQHMGDQALAVLRRLAGAADGDDETAMAYTDIAARLFVAVPVWVAELMLAFALFVASGAVWRGAREGRWRALAAPPLALIAAGVIAAVLGFALSALRGGEYYFAMPAWTRAWTALLGLLAIVLALALSRLRDADQADAVGAFWFALLGLMGAAFVPGISILFALPALLFALGWLVGLAWAPARMVGAGLAALTAVLLWGPTLYLGELALGFAAPFAFSVIVALVLLLALGVLVRVQAGVRWRGVGSVLAAATIVALLGAGAAPTATATRPIPLNVSTFIDADTGESQVIAGAASAPLPAELAAAAAFAPVLLLPGDRIETWAAPTSAAPRSGPRLEDVVVAEVEGGRTLRARLAMNGADRVTLRIPAADAPLRLTLNGAAVAFAEAPAQAEYRVLVCQGRACDGAAVALTYTGEGGGDWLLLGQYLGEVSPAAAPISAARPASATPIQNGDGVVTLSRLRP